jgi:hypothetical protein
MDNIIICKKCFNPLPESEFYSNNTNGRQYKKKICKKCDNERRGSQPFKKRKRSPEHLRKNAIKDMEQRRTPNFRAAFVLKASKSMDRRRGWTNDIELEFIRGELERGCTYCGEMDVLKIGLDRIDNDKPHISSNVVAACRRCNLFRRDMPYAAWIAIVPAFRSAKDAGLFGDWKCKMNYRKSKYLEQ